MKTVKTKRKKPVTNKKSFDLNLLKTTISNNNVPLDFEIIYDYTLNKWIKPPEGENNIVTALSYMDLFKSTEINPEINPKDYNVKFQKPDSNSLIDTYIACLATALNVKKDIIKKQIYSIVNIYESKNPEEILYPDEIVYKAKQTLIKEKLRKEKLIQKESNNKNDNQFNFIDHIKIFSQIGEKKFSEKYILPAEENTAEENIGFKTIYLYIIRYKDRYILLKRDIKNLDKYTVIYDPIEYLENNNNDNIKLLNHQFPFLFAPGIYITIIQSKISNYYSYSAGIPALNNIEFNEVEKETSNLLKKLDYFSRLIYMDIFDNENYIISIRRTKNYTRKIPWFFENNILEDTLPVSNFLNFQKVCKLLIKEFIKEKIKIGNTDILLTMYHDQQYNNSVNSLGRKALVSSPKPTLAVRYAGNIFFGNFCWYDIERHLLLRYEPPEVKNMFVRNFYIKILDNKILLTKFSDRFYPTQRMNKKIYSSIRYSISNSKYDNEEEKQKNNLLTKNEILREYILTTEKISTKDEYKSYKDFVTDLRNTLLRIEELQKDNKRIRIIIKKLKKILNL